MRRAVASELLKLRTTRTFMALAIACVGLGALIVALVGLLAKLGPVGDHGADLVGVAGFAPIFALVVGLLAVTTEFRHGTITPSLLAVPSRARLVGAKLVAHLIAGGVLGLAAVGLDLLLAVVILEARGIEHGIAGGDAVRWLVGVTVAGALAAALGVGIGAIVRNQVGAIVGVFVWALLIEPLLTIVPAFEEPVQRFGLGGLIDGADGLPSEAGVTTLAQAPAALLLAVYALAAALIGAALLRRRDVS